MPSREFRRAISLAVLALHPRHGKRTRRSLRPRQPIRIDSAIRQRLLARHSLHASQRLRVLDDIARRDMGWYFFPDHVQVAAGGNLSEHLQGVEPGAHSLQLDLFVYACDRHTLYVDGAFVRLDADFFSLVVDPHVVVHHGAPVAPAKGHDGRARVDFQHLPCKRGHHALERLVRRGKVGGVG